MDEHDKAAAEPDQIDMMDEHELRDELRETLLKLHKIRDKCLHEIGLDQRKSPFSEGRMDFAEVIWRMIEQEDPPQ